MILTIALLLAVYYADEWRTQCQRGVAEQARQRGSKR
jgi:hypothetical protein